MPYIDAEQTNFDIEERRNQNERVLLDESGRGN